MLRWALLASAAAVSLCQDLLPDPTTPAYPIPPKNDHCVASNTTYPIALAFAKTNFECMLGSTCSPSTNQAPCVRYCLKGEPEFASSCTSTGGTVCRLRLQTTLNSANGGPIDMNTEYCLFNGCPDAYSDDMYKLAMRQMCGTYFTGGVDCTITVDCGLTFGQIFLISCAAFVVLFGIGIFALQRRNYYKSTVVCSVCEKNRCSDPDKAAPVCRKCRYEIEKSKKAK